MQVGVGYSVADVHTHAEPDAPIRGVFFVGTCCWIVTAHRTAPSMPSNTINEKSPPVCTIRPLCMVCDGWVNHLRSQSAQSFECTDVVPSKQIAVADHVGVDDRDKLPPG